jgi:DEAD/DEAH box helicase domain-containing protein
MSERLVLDVETQKDFAEVEGRKPELLGASVICVYSYESNRYDAYLEADIASKLGPRLQQAELIIGFNNRRFDMPVLQPYLPFSVTALPQLDILEEIVKNLGHRVSLDSVAQAALGKSKSGSGLDALRWFKEGRFDLITKYCLDDVKITKDVYDYGKQHGRLFATSRFGGEKLQIPVFWPDRKRDLGAITKMVMEASAKRLQVEIEYLSQSSASGESPHKVRRVDIYYVREPYFEGYCHLRKDVRQFRLDRVLDIKPTWQRYTIPPDFVPTAPAA